MGNCIQKCITIILGALVNIFGSRERTQNKEMDDKAVYRSHPHCRRERFYVRLNKQRQPVQVSLVDITFWLPDLPKYKRMRSYLAYPNFFDEGKTYLKSFTKTIKGEESPLHKAILGQRHNVLDALLDDPHVTINIKNENFESLLLAALRIDNKDASYRMAIRLLKHPKIDVNLPDYNGDTPLHEAVKFGIQENMENIVTLLLEHPKIEVDARNGLGESPLHVAKSGKAATMLLDHGADVNLRDCSDNIALHKQVKEVGICEVLLLRGSERDQQNKRGLTPLHEAAWNSCEETVHLFLDFGVKPNIENDRTRGRITPLGMAYWARASVYVKDRLWMRSKPIYLLFAANYDTSKVPEVMEHWNSNVKECDVAEFIIQLICLLKAGEDLNWVTCGRLIGDFFLQKIPSLYKYDCQRIIRKFSTYMKSTMISFMLKTQDYKKPSCLSEVRNIIYTLLDNGDHLVYSDLAVIFTEFGDCKLLHKLLKLPIHAGTRHHKELPFFIRTMMNLPAPLNRLVRQKHLLANNMMDFYSVHCLARYCTLPPELVRGFKHMFENLKEFEKPVFCQNGMEKVIAEMEKQPKIPSLLEMSRNVVRPYLSKICRTSRPHRLRSILEKIYLPPGIINIILLSVAIYPNIKPPKYKPFRRHTYLI